MTDFTQGPGRIRRRRRKRLHDMSLPYATFRGWYFPRPNEIPTGTVQAMVDHASFEGALP